MFGLCHVAIAPLRAETSDRAEIVSQVLFGEHFEIIEQQKMWSKVRLAFDGYEGWIDNKQFKVISDAANARLNQLPEVLNGDLVEFIADKKQLLTPVPLGANLTFLADPEINTEQFSFEGSSRSGVGNKTDFIETAFLYLNAPYLWGGRTPFGIDCSGFTQMVYRLNGYMLPRDASQQATSGEALSFIEESEPGDLAFFDNEEGRIVHVGIIMADNYIIHASGKVRIDRLDHLGIYNAETNRHTHKLRVIKKYL